MAMKNKNFVVFILTHGRSDIVITDRLLRSCGYTGRIVYILDNEDKTIDKYIEKYGKENVEIFDKKKYADMTDEGDNFNDRRTITHARNASYDIAEKLGYKYFIQLDDDYKFFEYRFYPDALYKRIRNMDSIFDILLDFYKSVPNVATVAMAQGGDFVGGVNSDSANKVKRKAMNSFICSPERRIWFLGRMNEDVNTYTNLGSRGLLFLTIPFVILGQKATQSQDGGITEMYLDYGTFVKAFTTVMFCPSFVRVGQIGYINMRLHHKIRWKNAVPKIIPEHHRK